MSNGSYCILRIGLMASCHKLGIILVIKSFFWYKKVNDKKWAPKLVFFNEKKFLTPPHCTSCQNSKNSLGMLIFSQKSFYFVPLDLKHHNRYCHRVHYYPGGRVSFNWSTHLLVRFCFLLLCHNWIPTLHTLKESVINLSWNHCHN